MITLKKVDYYDYHFDGTEIEERAILRGLTFAIEGAEFSNLYKEDKWDGNVHYYNERNRTFPVGHLPTVVKALEKNNIKYKIENTTLQFHPNTQYNSGLHEHQKEAIEAFFKVRHGIIKVPTRGGKTFIAAESIRLIKSKFPALPVLFIVDGEDLFEQAIDDIAGYLKVDRNTIGKIKGKAFEPAGITIATIQTIESIINGVTRNLKGTFAEKSLKRIEKKRRRTALLKFFDTVRYLIVDECHEYGNKNRVRLLEKIKYLTFGLYLSATPFKSESIIENLNMLKVSGEIIYEIPEEVLKERGVLARDLIILLYINHNENRNIQAESYREYEKEVITHNPLRNSTLVYTAEICRKLGLKTLILFTSIAHGTWISSIMGDEFLNGGTGGATAYTNERVAKRVKFLKEGGGVLLASNIFKKGITLPQVQVMINAGGGKEEANVIQKKGRVLGVVGVKNKAVIIDFLDDFEYFKDHSLNRIKAYEKSVPKENILVFDTGDRELYNDLRAALEDWFNID